MFICPECRSVYMQNDELCERDQVALVPVQANQDPRTYPLLNQELDGRYHLIGGLGQGGVGTVYLANHIHLDQLSAVKFLDVDMLGEVDEEQREESLQDFVKEAKLAMMLRHDYVVRVMDYGVHERCPFLVMEYVPGPSLLRRMNAGERFDVQQCVNIISRLANALSAFHDRKLVHRDLKPANVILDPRDNGELTLVDLGLVKDLSNEARSSTHPLALRGTPGYLAPEQVPSWVLSSAGVEVTSEKQPVDARVDVYALGVLAFELLSGKTPYPKGMSPTKVIVYTCTRETPNLAQLYPHIDQECPGLSELVMSMMAKKPKNRPLDARGVLNAIEKLNVRETSEVLVQNEINSEISKATQALVDHVRSVPLAKSDLLQPSPYPVKPSTPPEVNYSSPHIFQTPGQGSLIPPPASLQRQNTGDRQAIDYAGHGQDSTLHLEGTMDDFLLSTDISISEDQRDIHTEISDRPLSAYNVGPIHQRVNAQQHVFPDSHDQQSKDNSKMFWIGVVLIAIVIGIFSALLGNVPSKQSPRRIVMGNGNVNNVLTPNKQSSKKTFTKPLKRRNRSETKRLKAEEGLSFATPGTIKLSPPKTDSSTQDSKNTARNRSNSPGIVELKVNRKETQTTPRAQRKVKNNRRFKKSNNKPKRAKITNGSRTSKPLTKSQYRLLKLQVENLLRNQRVREAKRRLTLVKKRLKPSDQFYLEINMLLDSISQ